MRLFRSITKLSSVADISRISDVLKKTADKEESKFEQCAGGGLYAFRLTFNGEMTTESVVTDGKTIIIEVHCVRGTYGTDERPLSLNALLKASLIPGTEKPFASHDRKAYIMDKYDVLDIYPYLSCEKQLQMPLVYMSYAPSLFRTVIGPDELQQRLLGEAHVAAEKDREATSAMREQFKGKGNPFGGWSRIVMPSGKTKDVDLMQYTDSISATTALVSALREFACTEKQYNSWNWNSVYRLMLEESNGNLKDKTDRLTALVSQLQEKIAQTKASEELDSLFDELYSELDKEKEQRYVAQSEAARWKSLYESKSSGDIFLSSSEKDLYKGEIRDTILLALCQKVKGIEQQEGNDAGKLRMYAVLKDIVSSNPADGTGNRLKNDFFSVLTDAKDMTPAVKGKLQKLGFELVSVSPHTCMNFCSDPRYKVVLANTPSDKRSRQNEASHVSKQIFPW